MRLASAAPSGAVSGTLTGAIASLLVLWSPGTAQATDLVVKVSGIPAEAWGVSNNVRPRLRKPGFAEASFRIPGDSKEFVIDIKVAK